MENKLNKFDTVDRNVVAVIFLVSKSRLFRMAAWLVLVSSNPTPGINHFISTVAAFNH